MLVKTITVKKMIRLAAPCQHHEGWKQKPEKVIMEFSISQQITLGRIEISSRLHVPNNIFKIRSNI